METIPASINNRYSAAFTASGVTSPTSPTSAADELAYDQQTRKGQHQRKPVGGIAVLPPMEMKRIEDQRRTPTSPNESKLKSPTSPSDRQEVCFCEIFVIYLLLKKKIDLLTFYFRLDDFICLHEFLFCFFRMIIPCLFKSNRSPSFMSVVSCLFIVSSHIEITLRLSRSPYT